VTDGDTATRYDNVAARIGSTFKMFDGRWIHSANFKHFQEHTQGLALGAVTFGADGRREAIDYKSTLLLDSQFAGGEKHTITVLADHKQEEYKLLFDTLPYIKRRTGIAGEYVLDLATHTTISGALRHDDNDSFADFTTWRVALSQRFPSIGSRLHASHGKGVTDPSVFELFGSQFNLPNPGLLPEQSIGWDVGIEHTWHGGRVISDVTYFESRFTDKIELTFDAVRGGFIYLNGIGAAKRRGVEIAGTWRLLAWLTATTTYTYTEAFDSLGFREVRRPPHSASVETTALFLDNKARATIGVIYNGTRKDFIFTPLGTLRGDLPGATVVRGLLSYDVTPSANVYLRAENIFDTQYEEVFSYRAPGFAAFAGIKVRTPD
jgi:vitamin B12 transporter